ncbi:MAG: hypothetical protein AAF829_09170 [Pseudomonadota bacterium]
MTGLMQSAPIGWAKNRHADQSLERIAWIGWFILFGMLSAIWPRDAGFDVMHYHLHNGWSAMNGRLHSDLAPAEMHSFLNPTYSVVVWWLIDSLPGPAVAFILGLGQATILPVLFGLVRRLASTLGRDMKRSLALGLALLGFFCAPAWSSFASLRNDHLGAVGFLIALYLALPKSKGGAVSALNLLLAAGCVGFVAGLKLTNIIYVPAFAVFVLVLSENWTERARRAALCAGAGATCFLIAAGPWMLILWQEFSNPVYPNFANAFGGPDAPTEASRDMRYLPKTLVDAISLPIRASVEGRFINELAVFDLRLALGYFCAISVVILSLGRHVTPRPAIALTVSLLTVLGVWIGLFSIMRYAAAFWMLAPLMAWTAWTVTGLNWPAGRMGSALFTGLGLTLLGSTSPENVRRIGWDGPMARYVSVERPADLDYENAMIFIAAEFPAAFTATAFPEARITHIDAQDWSAPFLANYRSRIEEALEAHDGPLYLIHCWPKWIDLANGGAVMDAYTAVGALEGDGERYGLSLGEDACRDLPTSFSTDQTRWQICPVEKG